MAEFERFPRHFIKVDFHEPCEVLSKIQDGVTFVTDHFFYRNFFLYFNAKDCLVEVFGKNAFKGNRLENLPVRRVIQHFTIVHPPVNVRAFDADDAIFRMVRRRSVFVFHDQNPRNGRLFTVDLHLVFKGKATGIPTLSQINTQDVFALQHSRYVIFLHLYFFRIIGIARGKEHVAHLLSVDLRFVNAKCRDGKRSLFYVLCSDLLLKNLNGTFRIRARSRNEILS